MEHASVYGGCPAPVSRRMAAAVRGPLGRVMPALTALPESGQASLRGGYQLLRCAFGHNDLIHALMLRHDVPPSRPAPS